MKEILSNAEKYKYTSLQYMEEEDLNDCKLIFNDGELIMLTGDFHGVTQIHWATNNIERLINEIILLNKDVYVEFIPEEYEELFRTNGFTNHSEWVDFFNDDIWKAEIRDLNREYISEEEYEEVSELTKKCAGQSRGFYGEDVYSVKEWATEEGNNIIITRIDKEIVGCCFVSIYNNGTIVWVREVAVSPEYQGRGYGKDLIEKALAYGRENGAKRGFLAADVLNRSAIGLYEKYDFRGKGKRGQINMIRE